MLEVVVVGGRVVVVVVVGGAVVVVVGGGPVDTTSVTVAPSATCAPAGGEVEMTSPTPTAVEFCCSVFTWRPSWPSVFDAAAAL